MINSLPNLVDNLAEEIHKIKCKFGHDNKKNLKRVELNTKILSVALNTQALKMIWYYTIVYVTISSVFKETIC